MIEQPKPKKIDDRLETKSVRSVRSKMSKTSKARLWEAIENADDHQLEDLKKKLNIKDEDLEGVQEEGSDKKEIYVNPEEEDPEQKSELYDEIDSLYQDEARSVVSKAKSVRSNASNATGVSSKVYINQLEKQLDEERKARERLQRELEEVKKLSSEVSKQVKA